MQERIIIAGAGGQGIMLLGKVLGLAAMRENRIVTCLPCYGAQVRGGTAHCMVIISDKEIGSPHVREADTLIIMNQPSLERFKGRLMNKGTLIINSSLAKTDFQKNDHIIKKPFTETAIKLGNIRIANMVALGCYISAKKIVDIKTVFKIIEDIAPEDKKDLIKINKQALKKGAEITLTHTTS